VRVCIDIQSAVTQRAGIGRYTLQLAQRLGRYATDDSLVLTYFDFRRAGLPFSAPGAQLRPIRWCPGRAAQWAWKRLNWPPYDRLAGTADVFHFPNFVIPPLRSGRTVVSIHDVSFARHPEFAEKKNLEYLSARIRDTVQRADAIITISEFSASELCELMNVERSRLHPIHLGIAQGFAAGAGESDASALEALGIDGPYLLTVGTVEPRKNLPFMIDVFEQLTAFDGKLVIAGMLGWKYEPILERIRASSRAKDIHYVSYVPDECLPALYAGADLFLLTSHYEGFGFTPLEAMACGTPVLSSAGGSLPEVLGDAAVVIDTFDAGLWAERAQELLTGGELRERLIPAGRERAARYTWEDTITKTWDVYRSLA
jgi:glycosyltransferase involved in cell wall biosynthesis